MAAIDLTPEEQADRLIGKSIEASSRGDVLRAVSASEDARNVLDRVDYPGVHDKLNEALTTDVDGSEWRRYCEQAREKLGVTR